MGKISRTAAQITLPDYDMEEMAQRRLDNLTKPAGSLGRLEELARKIAGIKKAIPFSVKDKVIFTMASDHGVSEEGVSAYPQEVTLQMVYNFLGGGAAINILASCAGARVEVVDMGVKGDIKTDSPNFHIKKVGYGTGNFTKGPAMTKEAAAGAIEAGIDVFGECMRKGNIDIIGTGDMGIANTASSCAVAACITGQAVESLAGRGTGITDEQMEKKINVIKKGIEVNRPDRGDPIDILSKVGGFEIGGIAGLILRSAAEHIPVVIDGYIASCGALVAYTIAPDVKHYIISAHKSKEAGHRIMLDYMGMDPLLDLSLRLGEGTGSALAMGIIDAAAKIFADMATFEEANVARKEDISLSLQ